MFVSHATRFTAQLLRLHGKAAVNYQSKFSAYLIAVWIYTPKKRATRNRIVAPLPNPSID